MFIGLPKYDFILKEKQPGYYKTWEDGEKKKCSE